MLGRGGGAQGAHGEGSGCGELVRQASANRPHHTGLECRAAAALGACVHTSAAAGGAAAATTARRGAARRCARRPPTITGCCDAAVRLLGSWRGAACAAALGLEASMASGLMWGLYVLANRRCDDLDVGAPLGTCPSRPA